MNYAPSHLQRPGDHKVGRGDLTGRRAAVAAEDAKERAAIIENSVRELQDPDIPVRIVPIPGRTSSAAVPVFVYDAIVKSAKR